ESEPARIIQEVGILGLLGTFLIRLLPFALLVPRWRRCKDRHLLALYAASIPFLFAAAFSNLAFNHTLSSVYWCVVALLLGVAELPEDGRQARGSGSPGWRLPQARGATIAES